MKRVTSIDRELTQEQLADLHTAANTVEPNTEDTPEAPAANWRFARRLYRPRKEAVSLRIDADVLEWLRQKYEHYQPEINRMLRERMESDLR